jgi:type II secretory ATPase GspE/PulE/Tfp pilus assembly ATPase PilB-like protein
MRDGLVSKEELEEILDQQQDTRQQRISGRRLGEILIQRGRVTPSQVARLVAEQYELPFLELELSDIDLRAASLLSEDDARRFWAIPVSRRPDGSYLLAIADPATVLFSDELRKLLGSLPRFAVVGPDAIERAIDFVHSQPLQFPSFVALVPAEQEADVAPLEEEGTLAPATDDEVSTGRSLAETWPPLGALLVREGFLSDADLDTALAQQRLSPSRRLGEILVEKGIVTPSVVARLVAEQYELPFVELEAHDVDPDVARRLPEEIARRLCSVPMRSRDDEFVEIAIADPTSAVYSDELQQALDAPLAFVVASPGAIAAVLDAVHVPEPEPEPSVVDGENAEDETADAGETNRAWRIVGEPPSDVAAEAVEAAPVEPHVFEGIAEAFQSDDAERWTPIGAAAFPSDGVEEPPPFETAADPVPEPDLEPEVVLSEAIEDQETDSPVDVPFDDEEPSWAGRLELVDQVAWEDETEYVESDHVTLAFLPSPETADDRETVEDAADDDMLEAVQETMRETVRGAERTGTVFSVPAERTDRDEELADAVERPEPVERDETTLVEEVQTVALETATGDATANVDVETESETEVEDRPETELEAKTEAERPETDAVVAAALEAALAAGATTVHFSPLGGELVVRARVDGAVRDLGTVSHLERDAVVEQLERDGRVRAHVLATSRGEKTTLFVREPTGTPTTIEELGADAEATSSLRTALERSSGAILVCGPGGSGTTTTLYAALRACATPDRIVTTIEHPVERLVPDVDQIEVDLATGVTFASALRELRFTDPDVVLVGELADLETAELALRTAYEGRIVLSSFPSTGGTAAALVRLADTGVDPMLLASAVGCVVSQRLVRSVCPDCRETYYASDAELEALGHSEDDRPRLLARGRGCPSCEGSGFRGRTGLLEVLSPNDEIRALVREGASAKKIQRAAVAAGMRTLRDEGVRLCLEGVTTVDEVERVLGAES